MPSLSGAWGAGARRGGHLASFRGCCLPVEPAGRSVVVHHTRGKSRLRPNHTSHLRARVGVTTAVNSLTGRDRWIGHPGSVRPAEGHGNENTSKVGVRVATPTARRRRAKKILAVVEGEATPPTPYPPSG